MVGGATFRRRRRRLAPSYTARRASSSGGALVVSLSLSLSLRRQRRLPAPSAVTGNAAHPPSSSSPSLLSVAPAGGHRTEGVRAFRRVRPAAATQDGCMSLTRGRQTGQGYGQPVDIGGTCGYANVGPVPEERDPGQEARGEFLSVCSRRVLSPSPFSRNGSFFFFVFSRLSSVSLARFLAGDILVGNFRSFPETRRYTSATMLRDRTTEERRPVRVQSYIQRYERANYTWTLPRAEIHLYAIVSAYEKCKQVAGEISPRNILVNDVDASVLKILR